MCAIRAVHQCVRMHIILNQTPRSSSKDTAVCVLHMKPFYPSMSSTTSWHIMYVGIFVEGRAEVGARSRQVLYFGPGVFHFSEFSIFLRPHVENYFFYRRGFPRAKAFVVIFRPPGVLRLLLEPENTKRNRFSRHRAGSREQCGQ